MDKININFRKLAINCLKTSKYELNEQNIERLTNMLKRKTEHTILYYQNIQIKEAIKKAMDEFKYGSIAPDLHSYYDSIFN